MTVSIRTAQKRSTEARRDPEFQISKQKSSNETRSVILTLPHRSFASPRHSLSPGTKCIASCNATRLVPAELLDREILRTPDRVSTCDGQSHLFISALETPDQESGDDQDGSYCFPWTLRLPPLSYFSSDHRATTLPCQRKTL